VARTAQERTHRRTLIAKALYHCISKQGYANTSLKDIADRAGMSPSHVGYYFEDRAAILEYYALGLCEQIVGGFPDLVEPDTSTLADAIASYCFGEGQLNTAFLGVLQELSGLAVHDPRLREIKAEHATAWRKYLEAFFERAKPANELTPRKAAWLMHAILVGFDTNTLFDSSLGRESAHELFRGTLRALAGLEPNGMGSPADAREPAR
jgi:AcrR family transcriptional regulator